jgi:pyruvate ferredoxin oxidoreductase alpha subunit
MREALQSARRIVVIEKSLAAGLGGILATDIRMALSGLPPAIYTVIAGLGGRPITRTSLKKLFEQAGADSLERLTYLDLNLDLVRRHVERESKQRRSGPIAENVLRDLQPAGVRIG